jgi:hypothetical protein
LTRDQPDLSGAAGATLGAALLCFFVLLGEGSAKAALVTRLVRTAKDKMVRIIFF